MTPGRTLLLRAYDAGDTYVSFRWLDDSENPVVHRIPAQSRDRALGALARALVEVPGEQGDDDAALEEAVREAVTGPFTRRVGELGLSATLSALILPKSVCQQLLSPSSCRVLVRITPSRMLARVPFELLPIDDLTRLIEVADLCYEPPAAVHVGRSRLPEPWSATTAARPVAYLIDPQLPAGSGLGPTLPRGAAAAGNTNARVFKDRLATRSTTRCSGVGKVCGRWDLSEDLNQLPGRLVYFGHATADPGEPGSASLHLSDDARVWGVTQSINKVHRPLSALDLLLGTARAELNASESELEAEVGWGPELWPMPPRVAIIACEGGVDFRTSETFGLVMAIFNAGAEVVTTTRWTLPSDNGFHKYAGVDSVPGPTTELALAVDTTHEDTDPIRALGDWQRQKLQEWMAAPGPATSPLVWAAAACHTCPPREVVSPRLAVTEKGQSA